jgi:hypothetical protein
VQTVASRLPNDDLVAELKALNARFIHNYVTNDVASHDAMMHPEFICIGPQGIRQNRTDYLRQWATQFDPEVVVYWDVRDEVITIIDTDTTSMSTYTDTYLLQKGEWKCIQAQIQTLPSGSYPDDDTIVSIYIKGKRQ